MSDQLHFFPPPQALTGKTDMKKSAHYILSTQYYSYCNGAYILTD